MTRKSLIANSPDILTLVSAAGAVIHVSASSAEIFGYPPEELLGRNILELVHLDDRDQWARAFLAVVARASEPVRVKVRVCQKDREWSPVECTIFNLLDRRGLGAMVVNYRELHAIHASTERRQQNREDPPHPNADLEDFASLVVHDLREPLKTISMFTDLLVRGLEDDPDRRELTKFIIDGVAQVFALLDGLYSIAVPGLDEGPRPVDLGHLVADVLQNLASAINSSDAIVTVDALPEVQGNPNHLMRVFQNLIVNAIKYRSDEPIRITVSSEAVGPAWIIKVKDNGIGIAQEHHECVFRPLKRLHGQDIPGAGLGLAVCKKIVEASGGAIWVESSPGGGSTFCFTILAMERKAGVAVPVAQRRSRTAAGRIDSMRAMGYGAG